MGLAPCNANCELAVISSGDDPAILDQGNIVGDWVATISCTPDSGVLIVPKSRSLCFKMNCRWFF